MNAVMESAGVSQIPSSEQFDIPGLQTGLKGKRAGWYNNVFSGTPPNARALLENYAGIPPYAMDAHVLELVR